ncbi:hypothetical protein [Chitinimonas lacunae]|uniref:Uncharacterized protein n=1 Tax=Chitinimonas lacunae TaxID=1963018 RepID=A0ABV8MWC5_9NEIS
MNESDKNSGAFGMVLLAGLALAGVISLAASAVGLDVGLFVKLGLSVLASGTVCGILWILCHVRLLPVVILFSLINWCAGWSVYREQAFRAFHLGGEEWAARFAPWWTSYYVLAAGIAVLVAIAAWDLRRNGVLRLY